MEKRTLLKANLKRHKGNLLGILLLTLLACGALGTVLTVWLSSRSYLEGELDRAGFGNLTAWVSGGETEALSAQIAALPEVERVERQRLIFTEYETGGQESDSEGQLIPYAPEDGRYRFFAGDLSGYLPKAPTIRPGEVWLSPSMVSMFGTAIGDEITFPIARNGGRETFTVRGFYEDPFMGSSMIGMKGFLIAPAEYEWLAEIIADAGIDGLARTGAMLHIFGAEGVSTEALNAVVNQGAELSAHSEFVHSRGAILGFMLVLQNAFSAILTAFALVLLLVVLVVLRHSITGAIETDYRDMGILKTVGFTGKALREVQLAQYLPSLLGGLVGGFLLSLPLSRAVSAATLTTTGVKIPASLPAGRCGLLGLLLLLVFGGFIWQKTGLVDRVQPMAAIRGEVGQSGAPLRAVPAVDGKRLCLSLALRQLSGGSRRYLGAWVTALLLVFFASVVGRMDSWLGPDGKGMMDAFNPADHDIGVQIFGDLTVEETETAIRAYSEITDRYLLAMPGVAVEGVDYTANVITEPQRFHLLRGTPCYGEDEIVITEFVADSFGVEIGDTLTVAGGRGNGEFTVTGIYSCANDMGQSIGMSREGYLRIGTDDRRIWCTHYFLADPGQKAAITAALENAYGGDVHIHENTWPGLLGILAAMKGLLLLMYGLTAAFAATVTGMTGTRLLAAERQDMGICKALGLTSRQLRLSFALRFGVVAALGGTAGVLLAAVFTDPLVSRVMKLAGISSFASAPGPGAVLFPAAAVALLFFGAAYLTAGSIKRLPLTVLVSE